MNENDSIITGAPTARSGDDVADALFGSTESLATDYGPRMKDATDRLTDAYGWSQEERSAHEALWMHTFNDARIRAEPGSVLHSLYAKHADNPPDQKTLEAWSAESRALLREKYGPEEAARRLATVRQFISARPEFERALYASGMQAHPRFVEALTESPHTMRVTPRPRAAKK